MRTADFDATPFGLAAALLIGLGLQVFLHADPIPAAAPGHLRPQALRGPIVPPAPGLPDYPDLVRRPLFGGGVTPVGGDVATTASETVTLLGLARAGGQASVVLRMGDGSIHTLKVGQELMGWRLAAVGAERALVVRDGAPKMLVLGAPATAATAPTAGARP